MKRAIITIVAFISTFILHGSKQYDAGREIDYRDWNKIDNICTATCKTHGGYSGEAFNQLGKNLQCSCNQ